MNFCCLIIAAIGVTRDIARAQVRFEEGVSLVRCTTKTRATAVVGHKQPSHAARYRPQFPHKLPKLVLRLWANICHSEA
jgi:hypothetical protein